MQKTILIVDSDVNSVQSFMRYGADSFSFIQCASAEDAYSILESINCVAVILDPNNCGSSDCFELIRVLKDENNGWPKTSVIVWSKDIEPEIVTYCWSMGVDECLRKPFDPFVILRFIDNRIYKD